MPFFYSLPPKRDFQSTRITPKCLNSAVLAGKLIGALTPTLCPSYCFPAGLQAQSVPHDNGWGIIAALVVRAQEGDGVMLCAQGVDCRDNKDMKGCTKTNQEGRTQGELSISEKCSARNLTAHWHPGLPTDSHQSWPNVGCFSEFSGNFRKILDQYHYNTWAWQFKLRSGLLRPCCVHPSVELACEEARNFASLQVAKPLF